MPRNAFTSFHIAVSVPAKESYLLYVIPNPISACRVYVYKEHFIRTAAGWIPDALTELQRLPDFGVMPDPDDSIEGQTTRVYLLDIWLPPNADVARFRLEVQLKVADWIVRPMEVRVMRARVPDVPIGPDAPLPPIESGADTAEVRVLGDLLAGKPLAMPPPGRTLRGILRRNAVQDMALAKSLDAAEFARRALDLFRMSAMVPRSVLGAEWVLRLRDWLLTR